MNPIEEARAIWAEVAQKNGWYAEPFYVQVWLNPDGSVQDSVSFRGMTADIVIQLSPCPECGSAIDLEYMACSNPDCDYTA